MLWAWARFVECVAQTLIDRVRCLNFDLNALSNSLNLGQCHDHVNILIDYACLMDCLFLWAVGEVE